MQCHHKVLCTVESTAQVPFRSIIIIIIAELTLNKTAFHAAAGGVDIQHVDLT